MSPNELLAHIKDFEPGDLLAGAEIVDVVNSLDPDSPGSNEISMLRDQIILLATGRANDPRELKDRIIRQLEGSESAAYREPATSPEEGASPPSRASDDEPGISEETEETKDGEDAGESSVDMDVLASFLAEGRNHLDDIEERILSFENSGDRAIVEEIFRAMHTIKGVSSFLDLPRIQSLSHSMEYLLEDLRLGQISMDADLADLLLEGTDLLAAQLDEIQEWYDAQNGKPAKTIPGSTLPVDGIIARLESRRARAPGDPEDAGHTAGSTSGGKTSGTAPADAPFHIFTPSPPVIPEGYGELFDEQMLGGFISESSDLLDRVENGLLNLEPGEDASESIDEAFRAIHTVKGNAGFFQYADAETLCMDLESFLDTFRGSGKTLEQDDISIVLKTVDAIRSGLVLPRESTAAAAEIPTAYGSAGPGTSAERSDGSPGEREPTSAATGASPGDSRFQQENIELGQILIDMKLVEQEQVDEALQQQDMKVGEILVQKGLVKESDIAAALERQGKQVPAEKQLAKGKKHARQDIRVDTGRLDRLFNLVGELITAESMVLHNEDLEGLNLENFNRAAGSLNKITREIQELTMSIRMIPLDGLFNKMRRLVRDLSRKFSKDIHLHISGEDTEMDRNVIDEISDPLVHIIRNAIDHGIETAADRRSSGKNGAGNLTLSARYEGNEIWISIIDDGKGLNRRKILDKGLEKGIIADQGDDLGDEEVFNLIFEPGFSTAAQLSEISGRGVGMDVVKKNIEKLRGKVSISSVEGEGTEFILKIPLTLAIIDGIVFTVQDSLFSLPLTDIIEFHNPRSSELVQTETGRYVLKIRNELFPVVDLVSFYELGDGDPESEPAELDNGIMIITQAHQQKIAIRVDGIMGNYQQVLKALPEYMGDVRAVSGCSIMGSGEVCLIIDSAALIKANLE
ncbi:chemotaxis protein CheA [Salinispira pacifica]|uniref:Chemotaxis protein CheA n=1 Tax=Salinispira pacifica TaxID=1307761 RepID=V5WL15_9SPIO|nr:chemotaxis protein CheA [Salinispira pacifica]AHC15886.1 Signal transduction histidine kinase CheA [Salinispira pacifica]